jgi:hypothetical protein
VTDAVYEPAYEAYEGSRTSRLARIGAIAQRGLAQVGSSLWFWVILGVSFLHIAVRGAVLQIGAQGAQPGATPFSASFLADALLSQARFGVTFVLAAVAADVIAEDLETGGLTFYFTNPLTKPGYAAGKGAGPFAATLAVTAVPVLVLWLLAVAFTPEALYPDNVWLLPLGILAASVLVGLVTTLVVAAVSAVVGARGRTAAVWVGLVFLLAAAARVARGVADNADLLLIDLFDALERTTHTLLGIETSPIPELGAWLTVAGWVLVSLAGLTWGLHREEVAG